ncbi:hypothetical protein CC85DRAFT_99072 [Cutaneotrichosporon oleaginosum]|uniref:Uncharacterized protein n=1 Tax=Cutaneotrichosporon oleaginosum TaxID=879819 RepID=A0A0J0XLW5_9TREE|nr:uncharacterized protein CC85DRAFT_99072 [Cutaneotrichosporon oleaginosum]KLT42092.1 hypothetical protein CC85DRAFT_99072 [Cutaneotrichosporon oleaginosum]TXT04669.1 hypothetical protein COLE_07488 [Cutaneotrichosporon oleaginosum]
MKPARMIAWLAMAWGVSRPPCFHMTGLCWAGRVRAAEKSTPRLVSGTTASKSMFPPPACLPVHAVLLGPLDGSIKACYSLSFSSCASRALASQRSRRRGKHIHRPSLFYSLSCHRRPLSHRYYYPHHLCTISG